MGGRECAVTAYEESASRASRARALAVRRWVVTPDERLWALWQELDPAELMDLLVEVSGHSRGVVIIDGRLVEVETAPN